MVVSVTSPSVHCPLGGHIRRFSDVQKKLGVGKNRPAEHALKKWWWREESEKRMRLDGSVLTGEYSQHKKAGSCSRSSVLCAAVG